MGAEGGYSVVCIRGGQYKYIFSLMYLKEYAQAIVTYKKVHCDNDARYSEAVYDCFNVNLGHITIQLCCVLRCMYTSQQVNRLNMRAYIYIIIFHITFTSSHETLLCPAVYMYNAAPPPHTHTHTHTKGILY